MGWVRGSRGGMLGALAGWVLLMGCGGGADPREQAPSTTRQELVQTHTFAASADARVEEAQPTRNFGSESLLGADLSPRIESYLRFSLHGLTGTVTRATLRLYASDGTTDGPRVFLTSGGWTEGGLTWSNRSGSGAGMAPLDDKGAIASGTWVEFDVTGGVSGNGELNLAVVGTSGNGADFHSRESSRTDLRPQLVVTVESPLPADCLPQTDTYNRGFGPSEDGDVSQSEPGRNFGGSTALRVDGTPRLESYLKFSLFTEGLAIRQAWLELSAFDSTTDGPRLYPASNDWTEGTLTWNTRPGLLGGPAGNLGAINANTRVTYDVTGLVTAEEEYSFALLPDSANNVDFYSREVVESHLDPLLRLTLESPAFCSFRGAGSGLSRWVRRYGGAGPEVVKAVASHPEGGFVAAGRFGEAVFSEPLEGLALARYTAEGQPLWTRVVATRDVTVTDLTVTPTGHLLVVGQYHNAPDLGAGPLPSAPVVGTWLGGLFIARFTSSGALEWARGFVARGPDGSVQRVVPQQVATDASGSLAVAGGFAGVMNLGGGPLDAGSTSTPGYDLNTGGFLAKFSSEGQHLWSRAFRTQERYNLRATAVSTDAAGNVLAGGLALDATDLGDGPVGEYAPFLAKYSPSGSLLWKRLFSGAAGDVEGIQPQGPDRVAFSANLEGTFTFAGGTHTGGLIPWGGTTGFLGALSSSGADVWIRSVGSPFTLWVGELAVRGNGELTLLGRGEEEFDAGGGPLGFSGGSPYIPTSRPFVARYTADGAHLWSRTFDWGRTLDMALLPDGGVLLGSTLMHQLELDGQRFTPVGESDLLYLKLLP